MSPDSARRAEKLGYTNVKVFHEGLPVWSKKNFIVLSAQSLKEAYMDKDIPNVLVDVRPVAAAQKGFIKGAVTLPASDVAANITKFPPKDKKPPIIVVDDKGGGDATNSAKALIAAGYTGVAVLTGGMDAWQAAKYPVETGDLATTIAYVSKPRPGEIAIEDFKKAAASTAADTIIIDAIGQGVARSIPKQAASLPAFPYGVSTHRRSFPGTFNVGGREFEDFWLAVVTLPSEVKQK